jgi:hypothetical protein
MNRYLEIKDQSESRNHRRPGSIVTKAIYWQRAKDEDFEYSFMDSGHDDIVRCRGETGIERRYSSKF